MNRVFLYVAVLVVFGTSVFGMIFSHRIAGPIDRVCKYLETLTDGADEKETKLRFRKKDYFPELARALNQYLASPGKKKKTASK